jgi:5-methylcytosine-specific restriction protein A
MKPLADDGKLLDADFSIEVVKTDSESGPITNHFDLILESWGGPNPNGRPPRNPDYNRALELLLARLGKIEAKIEVCALDSRPVQGQPLSKRQLELPEHIYPFVLSANSDFHGLRLAIRSAQRTAGGNGGSRIRLRFTLPRLWSIPLLEAFLILPAKEVDSATDPWTEASTAEPALLEARVKIVRAKISGVSGGVLPPPPPGAAGSKQTLGPMQRFIRDPNVIAWVLERANGTCEVCNKAAPFQRSNGDPFLEVHHVRTLAEGGPDTVDNALAACPNCHRELHHGTNREVLRSGVIAGIARLVDYVPKASPSDQDGQSGP